MGRNQKKPGSLDRRGFLKAMSGTVGVATVAVAAGAGATAADAAETAAERVKKRYRADSENVKNFYRVNRY